MSCGPGKLVKKFLPARQGEMRHLLLGCGSGGLKTRLVAVNADDRGDVEIELVELLDKFLDPRALASPDRREG